MRSIDGNLAVVAVRQSHLLVGVGKNDRSFLNPDVAVECTFPVFHEQNRRSLAYRQFRGFVFRARDDFQLELVKRPVLIVGWGGNWAGITATTLCFCPRRPGCASQGMGCLGPYFLRSIVWAWHSCTGCHHSLASASPVPSTCQPCARLCRRRVSQFSRGVVRGTLGRRLSRQTGPEATR